MAIAQLLLLTAISVVVSVAVSFSLRIVGDRLLAEQARVALSLRRYGLRALPSRIVFSPSRHPTFVGRWRGRPVRLQHRERHGEPAILSLGTPIPTGTLKLGHISAWSGRTERVTGDPVFDRSFRLSGDAAVLSIFTSSVRAAVLRATRHGAPRIADGVLWLDCVCGAQTLSEVHALLDPLVDLAEHFLVGAHKPIRKLWIDWMTDPEPGVRRTCLELVANYQTDQPLPDFVEVLLTDRDPGVRLRAATLLGQIEPVVVVACDPAASKRLRLEAVRILMRSGSVEQRLLVASEMSVAGEVFAKAAIALCMSLGSEAESLVEGWLDVAHASLVRGAVRWAARHGSVVLLPRLRAIESRAARLSPLALETREAILAVRARGASAIGGLSVALADSGALSIGVSEGDTEGGALAVAEPE